MIEYEQKIVLEDHRIGSSRGMDRFPVLVCRRIRLYCRLPRNSSQRLEKKGHTEKACLGAVFVRTDGCSRQKE